MPELERLRELHEWYTKAIELFNEVGALMDRLSSAIIDVQAKLEGLAEKYGITPYTPVYLEVVDEFISKLTVKKLEIMDLHRDFKQVYETEVMSRLRREE